jgi:hypothetical protein
LEPPREIPENLVAAFTMGNKIKVEYEYRNDSESDVDSDAPVSEAFSRATVDSHLERIKRKEVFYYHGTDACLYKAIEKHSIAGKRVVVMGSETSWYESIILHYGGIPTTVEYRKWVSNDDRLTLMTVEEFEKNPITFDAAISISSFEHDGLGRYGDPIQPDADLRAMAKMKSIVKEGGLLFLSVPVRKDRLIWNLERMYGSLRLPKLLHGWQILGIWGWFEYQPVFVLQNVATADPNPRNLRYFLKVRKAVSIAVDLLKRLGIRH